MKIAEIDTAIEGFRLWPGALSPSRQAEMVAQVMAAIDVAPLYRPITPGGRPFSVEMTNMGPLGWVSDRGGYRYQPDHPETGQPWPAIPPVLLDLWSRLADWNPGVRQLTPCGRTAVPSRLMSDA